MISYRIYFKEPINKNIKLAITDLKTPLVDAKKLNEKFQKVADEIDSNWSDETLEKIKTQSKQVKDSHVQLCPFFQDFDNYFTLKKD